MNKSSLIESMMQLSGLTKTDTEKALNAFLDSVTEALKAGDEVAIVGFGNFLVKEVAARNGRNFKTGATMVIPSRKSVKFKPGKNLKMLG